MKCLNCKTNSFYRARLNGKCPQCQKEFVFEPKRGDPFTDTAFEAALNRVSAKNTLYYHPRHLYFELARRRLNKTVTAKGAMIGTLLLGLFLGVFFSIFVGFLLKGPLLWIAQSIYLGVLIKLALIAKKKTASPAIRLEWPVFQKQLKRWRAVQEPSMPLLLPDLASTRTAISAPKTETDLLDYNVDRLILCDKAEMVDFLLANQFHLEQKCAILAFNGYPRERFEEIKAMLQRNPNLMVYVIHNASTNGCRIAAELKRPDWFPQARIFDLGLNPRQAQKFLGLFEPANSPPVTISGLSAEDQAWLGEWKLDLMALPPASLLKHLRGQISLHQQAIVDAYARKDEVELDGGSIWKVDFAEGSDDDFG